MHQREGQLLGRADSKSLSLGAALMFAVPIFLAKGALSLSFSIGSLLSLETRIVGSHS